MTALLTLDHLSCLRGDRLLFDNVTATINKGDLVQIAGCNGSGKTSFLRLLLGFLTPFSGCITWRDSLNIIYVGHQNAIKPELTVLENLRYQFLIPQDCLVHVDAVLQQLGLATYANTLCRHLSQGQKQKVALARLWLVPADVWLLDAPFTALDSATIDLVEQLFLQKLQAGVAIIATTHRPFVLQALESRIKVVDLTV